MGPTAPGFPSLADPAFLLSRVGTAIQTGFKEVLASWKLRPLELVVLTHLNASTGGLSQQQLCDISGVDSGNMVEFVDALEALRYAKRNRDPHDRRRYIVTITPNGRSVLAEIIKAVNTYTDTFLNPLTSSERRQLTKALAKLYANTAEGSRPQPRPSSQRGRAPETVKILDCLKTVP